MLPHYMAMGQTPDEYWNGDPDLVKAYRQAFNIRLEQRNNELWLQGLYILDALSVVIGNSFGGKGQKKRKYMENPIRITPLTEQEKIEQQQREWEKIDRALHEMKAEQTRRKRKAKQAESADSK